MKEFLVIINTCRRPVSLCRLLSQLKDCSGGLSVRVNLYDDGSPQEDSARILEHVFSISSEYFSVRYTRYPVAHGKERYYELVSDNFGDLKNDREYDYYLMLPDDAILTEDFLRTASSLWDRLEDPGKLCLNTFLDNTRLGKSNWDTHKPYMLPISPGEFIWVTSWNDMEFIAGRRFFELLGYRCDSMYKNRWEKEPELSSGTGRWISWTLRGKGEFYQVSESLTYQEDHKSVMHPKRGFSFYIVRNMREGHVPVWVNMATIRSREKFLEQAVNSLLANKTPPDRLNIYLNDYKSIPGFLLNDQRINAVMHPYGDMADNGKFFFLKGFSGYYLTTDDDIIYPNDYIYRIIGSIECNHRKVIMGFHGAIADRGMKSYYHDRTSFSCRRALAKDTYVNVLGTGCMGFHTDTITVRLDEFRQKYMADIFFAIAAQQRKVPMMCLSHKSGWIKLIDNNPPDNIFERFRDNDQMQVSFLNTIDWTIHRPQETVQIETKARKDEQFAA